MKLVVFTGSLTYSVRKGIVEIDRSLSNASWLVVLHAPRKSWGGLMRSQWRNLRRNGLRWIPYQLADILERVKPTHQPGRASATCGAEYTPSALKSLPNLRILE